ncbi:MAG: hypothetical protein HKO62_05840 [Gammaproteobacteria bacterium]|nr:hypothetical protein [Gammaproteobacteria bacterium]
MTIAGPINSGVASLSTFDEPFFGDVAGTVDLVSGAVDIAISNLPTSGPPPDFSRTGDIVSAVTVTGSVSATSINLDYIVLFNCGGSPCDGPGVGTEQDDWAQGTIVATAPIPLPQAVLLVLPPLALLGRARRSA